MEGHGNSYRLGNAISSWYILCLEGNSDERKKKLRWFKKKSNPSCLVQYMQPVPVAHLTANQQRILRADKAFWWIYSYDLVQLSLPHSRRLISSLVDTYYIRRMNAKKRMRLTRWHDMVIHFRVGDFLKLGRPIKTRFVLDAARDAIQQLAIKGRRTRVVILNSGLGHYEITKPKLEDRYKKQGLKILRRIEQVLSRNCIVKMLLDYTVDQDFYIMTSARALVTGGGSLAISAAIVNRGIVRTPACKNLCYPFLGSEKSRIITDKWKTYSYRV